MAHVEQVLVKWIEVVVYLKPDYSSNESFWISSELSRQEITEEVNKRFKQWHTYDIL